MVNKIARVVLITLETVGVILLIDIFFGYGNNKYIPILSGITGPITPFITGSFILIISLLIIIISIMSMGEGSTIKQLEKWIASIIFPVIIAGIIYWFLISSGIISYRVTWNTWTSWRVRLIGMSIGIISLASVFILLPISMLIKMLITKKKDNI